MLGLFLCLLVPAILCELPPAGYPSYQARSPSSTASWPSPDGMSSDNIDAVFQRDVGRIYTFKGTQVWSHYDARLEWGTPFVQPTVVAQNIMDVFGIEGPIDAAFVRSNGKLYLFKDNLYYRYTDNMGPIRDPDSIADGVGGTDSFSLDAGYPKKVSKSFVGVWTPIDDVFELPNGHIYFFHNDTYTRIRDKYVSPLPGNDVTRPDRVDSCYPKMIAEQFLDIEVPVRAAFRRLSDRQIYFFGNQTFYANYDKYIQPRFFDLFEPPVPLDPIAYCVSYDDVPAVDQVPLQGDIAMFQRKTGKIYVFESATDRYWRLTDYHYTPHIGDCLDAGYPKSISANWVGAPSQINAVYQGNNGKIYFFAPNNTYVRFSDKYLLPEEDPATIDVVDDGYNPPLDLTHFGFRPDEMINREIIGAFQRANGRIYIFMQSLIVPFNTYYYRITDKYILLNEDYSSVDPGHGDVLLTDGFQGIPMDFDTVYQRTSSDRKIYFYKDGMVYVGRDKHLYVPTPCTACTTERPSED